MTYYYDEDGKEYIKEGVYKLCAFKESKIGQPRCKILSKSGSLFKKDLSLKDKNKDGWRLIEVNEECFSLYLEYLKKGSEFRYYEALRKV